ncbi:protein HEAT INTOLERANT 4-like [Senna tora]|uniref:Protein HEAT INTOLERANT 4-like n=1 Tax=Senna tora TaxID=362788 RepID=A0A835CBZ1_9FABA|nr:protein HEAT INTOLERANT 4-like [Senna tora]
MRKGAKKRTRRDEEAKPVEDNNKQSSKAASRAKRVKASKPESEPEYFEDKRNLEDLWRETFPVGTEWDQLDTVYQFKWNFSNLENAFEEGGVLHGKKVYLFGCTEPQLVSFKGESKVVCIPVVVAVVSPFPPSDKIGINSVQREAEEIIPMKQMKMDWVPYIPLEDRESQVDKLKSQIFILSCTQRRAALKHLKLDRVKKYEYCLPYFYQPFKEDELEQSTEVPIIFPAEPKPVFCEFDWELDELEEFTDKLIEEEELSEDQKDAFKEFVKEKVREAKKANREAREARKKAIEEMSEESKAAFENMRFYKFYPVQSPDAPDVSNVKLCCLGVLAAIDSNLCSVFFSLEAETFSGGKPLVPHPIFYTSVGVSRNLQCKIVAQILEKRTV